MSLNLVLVFFKLNLNLFLTPGGLVPGWRPRGGEPRRPGFHHPASQTAADVKHTSEQEQTWQLTLVWPYLRPQIRSGSHGCQRGAFLGPSVGSRLDAHARTVAAYPPSGCTGPLVSSRHPFVWFTCPGGGPVVLLPEQTRSCCPVTLKPSHCGEYWMRRDAVTADGSIVRRCPSSRKRSAFIAEPTGD